MGDCYRSTCFYLPFKQRNHATLTAQNIAETYSDKAGLTVSGKFLHIKLRYPFADTHGAGRVDSLVGRDHDKLLNIIAIGVLNQRFGAEYVVKNRLTTIELHHRYMFMSGGMEDNFRMILFEDLTDTESIGYAADDRKEIEGFAQRLEIVHQVVEAILGVIEKYHPCRFKTLDLATELRTD